MNRRGIALVAALSLLALLGLVVAGAVATMTATQRAARSSLAEVPLSAAASVAIDELLQGAIHYGLADLTLGKPTRIGVSVPSDQSVVAFADVTRLAGGIVWIMMDVRLLTDTLEHRRVSAIARFPLDGAPPAPLVFAGPATVDPDVSVTTDTSGAADCRAATASAALQTTDSIALFATSAQRTALDSASGVLRVRGDTLISAGRIDGVLVVDGSLSIDGPVVITGLVIVGGSLISLQGLHLTGAAIVRGSGSHLGGATIEYAPCAVSRALRQSGLPKPVRGRAWVEVF